MIKDLDYKMKLLFETAVLCENEHKIRTLCSEIIAQAQNEKNTDAVNEARKKLRSLENEKCRTATEAEMKEVDLAKLIENLSLCCDIVLSDAGKCVTCETQRTVAVCCPQIIIDAFLNLISNCAKFSEDGFIGVSLTNQHDRSVITVQNSGTIDFSKIGHGGIEAAENAARLHGGRLLYAAKGGITEAALCIAKSKPANGKYTVPDYTAFLNDEFSPVQIGLADVFG